MYHVGRIGSYITRGVYTVSGPFHPFGGAVDIIVVEQPDGTFKSSPWYVRFGKFQGVLKAREKEVNISVNGVDANFHMYLDQRGEAYFLREVEGVEEEFASSPSSSSDENSQNNRRPVKSKSCKYDGVKANLDDQIDVVTGEILPRTRSRRSRIFGLVFGRRSMKEDSYKDEDDVDGTGIVRISSLERAEIAADLLDVKWSTNLGSISPIRDNSSQFSGSNDGKGEKFNGEMEVDSSIAEVLGSSVVENCILDEEPGSCNVETNNGFGNQDTVIEEANIEISEISCSDTKIVDVPEAFLGDKFDEESGANKSNLGSNEIESFVCGEKLENSNEESMETIYLTTEEGPGEVQFCAKTMSETTELLYEDEEIELETVQIGSFDNYPEPSIRSPPSVSFQDEINLMDPIHGSVEVDSKSISSVPGFSNSVHPVEKDMIIGEKINMDELQPNGDCDTIKTCGAPVSESSEEEQFPFSDNDLKYRETLIVSHSLDDDLDKEYEGTLKIDDPLNTNNESYSSQDSFFQKDQLYDTEKKLLDSVKKASIAISIPKLHTKVEHLTGSLPNMWSQIDSLATEDTFCPLSRSLDSNFTSLEWKIPRKEEAFSINLDINKDNQLSSQFSIKGEDSHLPEVIGSGVVNPSVGDPPKTSDGSWGIWPFRKTRSRKSELSNSIDTGNAIQNVPESNIILDDDKNMVNSEVSKRKIRANTPTSEELASLNLKEGSNVVTFTFSTAMLGRQKVEARIYRWKWNTRIVISDVDGTITKSDVLGQFMPLVGRDWSQTGVAHLFSAIKENGYQLLFLSARAISQAYLTRQFLVNLKQDGKALPDGPVVISPDGLFPSLFREVIRRAPHEFKIACLEDIKALFPSDCNPFYAGFGNRDTDEFSYLKVGIPKGKIFIINPKGEVAVHRRIDTKSYTSLHALVHGMFPVMRSSEQEDFNSWNFWRLPLPLIDI